jgi:GTP-binding protein Era
MKRKSKKIRKFKSGFVALMGRTNVGKSTFLNNILGEKVSIVTPKPQTTRDRIKGILNSKNGQIIFIDTPGIHEHKKNLNKRMVREAMSALVDADLILLMIEASQRSDVDFLDQRIISLAGKKPVFLLINKIDLFPKETILPLIDVYSRKFNFSEIIPVCSITGDGFDIVKELILWHLPEGSPMYPEDQFTDRTLRFLCAEIIREKVFYLTHQEIPYSTAVKIDEMKEIEEKNMYRIMATIFIEKESQKPIIIGRAGRVLKEIGTLARREIESSTEKKVFLSLFVRVEPDWTLTEKGLKKVLEDK